MNRIAKWALIASASVGLLAASSGAVASAAIKPEDEYSKRIHAAESVSPLGSNAFGESVNLYNGAAEFSMVDIDLPGIGPPVQLRRRYRVEARIPDELNGRLAGFGDWSLDVPYIDGVFASSKGWKVFSANGYDRCSTPAVPDTGGTTPAEYTDRIWDGYRFNLPGQGSQELLVNRGKVPEVADGRTYPWITTGLVKLRCAPVTKNGYPGESFVAIAPDGLKYTLDWVASRSHSPVTIVNLRAITVVNRAWMYMLATRVEDRFGNWVDYRYSGDKLVRIEAKDGRFIALTWSGDRVVTVQSSSGQWSYAYRAAPTGYNPAMELASVTLPDQSQWTYAAVGTRRRSVGIHDDDPPTNHCQVDKDRQVGDPYDYLIRTPSGATADFKFAYLQHWRNYVPLDCPFKSASGTSSTNYAQPEVYAAFYEWSLRSKSVSGPGMPTAQWTYAYYRPLGDYYAASAPYVRGQETYIPSGVCTICGTSKYTVVTGPNDVNEYVYGAQYARNEGRLLSVFTRSLAGETLSFRTYTYLDESAASGQRFAGNIGASLLPDWENPMSARMRPIVSSATIRDGRIFQSDVLKTAGVFDFDVFARPTRQQRSSKDYVAPHPPASPPQITAPTSSDTGRYAVEWQSVAEATRYVLEESTNGGAWVQVGSGNVLNASFSGKDSGTYSYRAKACNDIGCSAPSLVATVTVALLVPLTPTLTMPEPWSTISVQITWTPVSAVRYELLQSTDTQPWTLKYSGLNPYFGLQQVNHVTYYYKVRACNNQACGEYSTIHQTYVDYERSRM